MQRELFDKKQCKTKGDKHITPKKKWDGEKQPAVSLPGKKIPKNTRKHKKPPQKQHTEIARKLAFGLCGYEGS